jgi:hypothetical protein
VGIRIIHRCTYTSAKEPNYYVNKYINNRLKNVYKSDLKTSVFLDDINFWHDFKKRKGDGLGHYFRQRRIKNMIKQRKSLLILWIEFAQAK